MTFISSKCATVAQLVEYDLAKVGVAGSSPVCRSFLFYAGALFYKGFRHFVHLRIEGNIMPRNRASIAVVEKCGFVREGISRKYLKINGVWEDHVHDVVLNEAME